MFLENKANILNISALQIPFIHPAKPFFRPFCAGYTDIKTNQHLIHNNFKNICLLIMMDFISLKTL